MTNQKGFSAPLFILAILAIIGLITILVYFCVNIFRPGSIPSTGYVSVTPSPFGESIKASEWKTYTNAELGFSIDLPPDAKIEVLNKTTMLLTQNEGQSTRVLIRPSFMEDDEVPSGYGDKAYGLTIDVEANTHNWSADQVIQNYLSILNKPGEEIGPGVASRIQKSLKPYKNGQIEGIYGLYGFDYTYHIIVQTHGNKIYFFDFGPYDENKGTEGEQIINRALSSFKFLGT